MQTISVDMEVAGFRLVEQVGIGSAGEVWRGVAGEQIAAVKFLNTSLLERPDRAKHLRRFRNEAYALELVSDLPHIPTHLYHDLEGERPFIVMEFIKSPPLSDLMIKGEMMYIPLHERLNALQRVAETLSIIHQRGIVHRDIKPNNIHGIRHPYLLDFSIGMPAKYSEKAARNVGTPLYLTPDLLPPSARTDSYAFTITVYEILFGRHPIFDYSNVPDNTPELLQQAGQAILDETWHRPNQLEEADVPINLSGADLDRLTSIFQNALMLSEDRYANVAEFMNDVIDSIHVEDNLPFIESLPLPTNNIGVQQIATAEHSTDHLAQIYSANTDLPELERLDVIFTRQWVIGFSLLFGTLFIVLLILSFSP